MEEPEGGEPLFLVSIAAGQVAFGRGIRRASVGHPEGILGHPAFCGGTLVSGPMQNLRFVYVPDGSHRARVTLL